MAFKLPCAKKYRLVCPKLWSLPSRTPSQRIWSGRRRPLLRVDALPLNLGPLGRILILARKRNRLVVVRGFLVTWKGFLLVKKSIKQNEQEAVDRWWTVFKRKQIYIWMLGQGCGCECLCLGLWVWANANEGVWSVCVRNGSKDRLWLFYCGC